MNSIPDDNTFPMRPMRSSVSVGALFTALSKAQAAFPEIGKDKRATIATRSGAHYSYTYADLSTILSAIRKPLADSELSILQPVSMSGNGVNVRTVLGHSSGEWVAADLSLPIADPTDARSLASAVTYARRYSLIALLGIAPADEDDDADATVASASHAAKATRPLASSTPAPTSAPAADAPSEASGDRRPAPTAADYISDAQRRRLFAIARNGGWDKDALHAWLIQEGIGSTTKIRVDEYDAVVALLQRAAP